MKFKVPMMYKVFLSYFKVCSKSGRLPFTFSSSRVIKVLRFEERASKLV